MSKEYLDRKEVDNILTDIWDDEIVPLWEGIITATEEIRIQKSLDKLVNKICQLKPTGGEIMKIIRYVSEYDMALFNKRAINVVQLIGRSIADEINPDAKPENKKRINRKIIEIKLTIPNKEE